ncbi:hypothetical protein BBF96_15345 [Anoxybacter fermentans]|uniref:M23ase beta-sheet core domain-containing protein n=1 Tax=Anoxybacter fermentans TaxID=1323375 RepID=A0A3S9T271_9FIRM|nr:M23 family metallopeptidase [Anoxybacter fermentans]AZR74628.1 hypothetical protein BBF96_15345 [Anoxybacter fermentans]
MREILISLLMVIVLALTGPVEKVIGSIEVKVNDINQVQGEVLMVQVSGETSPPYGTFLGRELNFQSYQDGWIALIGISYWTEPGTYPLWIKLSNGKEIEQSIRVHKGDFKESHLTISKEKAKLVNPSFKDKAIIERKARDRERIKEAYNQSEPFPLWNGPFIRPAEGRITTGYGYTRYVNGKLSNRHSGLDIANAVGTPIYAVNDGIVRLAEELLVTGNTIIIDHGAGLYSSYSHLSELLVEEGEMVKKGQIIGKMGSTGFSTGSHLHWVMKIGDVYLNPEQFVGTDLFQELDFVIP